VSDQPPTAKPPAQITYTTNPLLSPVVLGALVTLIASIASGYGVHVLNDPAIQQQLIVVLGIIGTAIAHWIWPGQDGKMSLSAPLSTPAPQDVPAGASVINVPAPADRLQVADVQPLAAGTHVVEVVDPAPSAAPFPSVPTVVVSPGG
jgi:hypothetical protein